MGNNSSTLSLGTDNIGSLLFRYAVPAIIAMASSSLYHIIDSIFVGHGVGGAAIAGMAITMPIMNIASAFGAMVGVGAAARVSIRLGEGNKIAAVALHVPGGDIVTEQRAKTFEEAVDLALDALKRQIEKRKDR